MHLMKRYTNNDIFLGQLFDYELGAQFIVIDVHFGQRWRVTSEARSGMFVVLVIYV